MGDTVIEQKSANEKADIELQWGSELVNCHHSRVTADVLG